MVVIVPGVTAAPAVASVEDWNSTNLVIIPDEIKVEPAEWTEVIRTNLFRTRLAAWQTHWVQEIKTNLPDFILLDNPEAVEGLTQ